VLSLYGDGDVEAGEEPTAPLSGFQRSAPQSSSASRRAAGASWFLHMSHASPGDFRGAPLLARFFSDDYKSPPGPFAFREAAP
jgi:hypothetical protein